MGSVEGGLTVSALAIVILGVLDVWVYLDARSRAEKDDPVSVQVGGLLIEEPRAWLAFCVVLFVVFFPIYLAARRVAA